MYSKRDLLINKKTNENKVFDNAMKKVEDALTMYSKSNHYFGQAFCHKILSFIKEKLHINVIYYCLNIFLVYGPPKKV